MKHEDPFTFAIILKNFDTKLRGILELKIKRVVENCLGPEMINVPDIILFSVLIEN